MILDAPSEVRHDTLSDVLSAVRVAGGMFFRARFSAPYAVSSPATSELIAAYAPGAVYLLPFHLVTSGPMWFVVDGVRDPLCLETGDILVVPRGASHHVTDEPGRPPIALETISGRIEGTPPTLAWGGAGTLCEALCGFFQLDGRLFNPLLEALPDVFVVRHEEDEAGWMTSSLQRAYNELAEHRPGGAALVSRLTESLFVEVIQRYVRAQGSEGWFAALRDPVAGPALALIHAASARHWSVEELASEVGVSRTVLADRFTATVGQSPIRYLTSWRLEVAGQRLLDTHDSVAEVALAVGYESEAAFNRAFKRFTGQPPAAWRRAQRTASSSLAG